MREQIYAAEYNLEHCTYFHRQDSLRYVVKLRLAILQTVTIDRLAKAASSKAL